MIFTETKLKGSFILELHKFKDERGFFAPGWSSQELLRMGLEQPIAEGISFNKKKGTLRGMHYQSAPHGQAKLVRCIKGSVYDVIVDLRPGSPTFKDWVGLELTDRNRRILYLPIGFAHGFQTLEDETEILYHMSHIYAPERARGIRWNDPAFGIDWPDDERTIIPRDREYSDFSEEEHTRAIG
jgi:dTDP-4-dehydrorhamnose 3,5-epimerase